MGNPGQANYAASKAGVIGLTKTAAKELGRKNITVNAVAPGFIDTEMTRALPERLTEAVKPLIALRRLGEAEEVASVVAFLASDEASYITGQVLIVDGGLRM
jgi:3-oxoacyl-[acyl-carrier protein] reductase